MERYVDCYLQNNCSVIKIKMDTVTSLEASAFSNYFRHHPVYTELDTNVVVDLRDVQYLDSGALGLLLYSKKIFTKQKRGMSLVTDADTCSNWFQISKIYSFFDIFDNIEDACASFQKKAENQEKP